MSPEMIRLIAASTGETLYMVAVSALIATLFGLPLDSVSVLICVGLILPGSTSRGGRISMLS